MSPTIILLLMGNALAAWCARTGEIPRNCPIEGELGWTPCTSPEQLVRALADLRERLASELGPGHRLELLYAADHCNLLTSALPQLDLMDCCWQVQLWELLAARVGNLHSKGNKPSCDWVAENVLPLLLANEDASTRELLQEATRLEHASLTEQLQAEHIELQRANNVLSAQIAALRCVDAERLITYLPALYPRIFTEIGGHDLAMLTGRPEPYALPNPYPEPSPETLQTLQRDFRALPREFQRQIVAFLARMPQRQRIKPRPEMSELVLQLESE